MNEIAAGVLLLSASTVVPIIAKKRLDSLSWKYAQIDSNSGVTGAEVARAILQSQGIAKIAVSSVDSINGSRLSGRYNRITKTVKLSESIYESSSISALVIAAHECGHVLQDIDFRQRWQLEIARLFGLPFILWMPWIVAKVLGLSWLMPASHVFLAIAVIAGIIISYFKIKIELDASERGLSLLERLDFSSGIKNRFRKLSIASVGTYVATAIVFVLAPIGFMLISSLN